MVICGHRQWQCWESLPLVIGPDLQCQCTWKNLKVWRERDGWLILSPNAMPPLFLSVQLLKDAKVYDAVLALARQNAREFNN